MRGSLTVCLLLLLPVGGLANYASCDDTLAPVPDNSSATCGSRWRWLRSTGASTAVAKCTIKDEEPVRCSCLFCIQVHWQISTTTLTTTLTSKACDETLKGVRGNDYRGCQTLTREGRTCMKWTAQRPHTHIHTPQNFPGKGLGDHNYCRNPDYTPDYQQGTIWCYTTDPNKLWEFCSPIGQVSQTTATTNCSALMTPQSCRNQNFCIWDLNSKICQARYVLKTTGSCTNHITGGLSACSSAAAMLGLSSTTAALDGQTSVAHDPPYCYFEGGSLKYNDGGANTGSCSSSDQCVCTNVKTTATTRTRVSSESSNAGKSNVAVVVVVVVVVGVVAFCALVLAVVGAWKIMRRPKSNEEPKFLDPEENISEDSTVLNERSLQTCSQYTDDPPVIQLDERALTLLESLDADLRAAQEENTQQSSCAESKQLPAQSGISMFRENDEPQYNDEPQCIGNAEGVNNIHLSF